MSAKPEPPIRKPLFSVNTLLMTVAALRAVSEDDVHRALERHIHGDWGDLDADDRRANDRALAEGGRLFSAYLSSKKVKFCVVTNDCRSQTTVLMPEDA